MAQLPVQQAFELARRCHQSGRWREAEHIYHQILAQDPGHAEALHLLGVIAYQRGRPGDCVALIRQAIAIRPGFPEAQSNLGNALKDLGQLEEAIAAYRQAIALKPDFADAHYNLGMALQSAGLVEEAIAAYRQAIAIVPGFAKAQSNLGIALKEKGQVEEAVGAYRQALALRPDYGETHYNLGIALQAQGRLDEAITCYREAIRLRPRFAEAYVKLGGALKEAGRLDEAIAAYRQGIALDGGGFEAHSNLGNALRDQGRFQEAAASYREAIGLEPANPGAYSNLGVVLSELGQLEEAIAVYRQAIALGPDIPQAYNNLGNALCERGLLDDAVAAFGQAIALNESYAQAHNNLANALKERGQLDEAIASYRRALALDPGYVEAHDNLIFTLGFHVDYKPDAIGAELGRWNAQRAAPLKKFIEPHTNDHNPERRLRVGYVSPNFHEHPVGQFLLPLLSHHDRRQIEVFGYSQVPVPDHMTQRFRALADGWRNLVGLSDAQAADRIREDQIDILVDLALHTGHNRLLVFARKPAPVQVTYLGAPGSTGLQTMDYRVTDCFADPPAFAATGYTEELLRLPETAWCFAPPSGAPAVGELPALRNGHVTFGSFNNLAKVTAWTLDMWCAILQCVCASRLVLKSSVFASGPDRERFGRLVGARGIDPGRLELLRAEPTQLGHLEAYNRIDIGLDTFPYHGTTTTCEALWMGVPVVTRTNERHASRPGASLLSNVGLGNLAASSAERYVELAVSLSNDLPRLRQLRATLRQRMRQSPLMDAPQFARHVEAAYRAIWRKWCGARG